VFALSISFCALLRFLFHASHLDPVILTSAIRRKGQHVYTHLKLPVWWDPLLVLAIDTQLQGISVLHLIQRVTGSSKFALKHSEKMHYFGKSALHSQTNKGHKIIILVQ
jgi:hypothetical protein